VTKDVCYLKLTEEKNQITYRIIYTDADSLTRKLSLEFTADSDGSKVYIGHAPHDEYYAQGVLTLRADPDNERVFTMTLVQKDVGPRVVTTLRLSKRGDHLALTSVTYDEEGILVSTESADLVPCDPGKPPSYPIVAALGGWELESDAPSTVTATEVDDDSTSGTTAAGSTPAVSE